MALIGLLIAQVVSAVSSATKLSNQGVDAAAQSRLALDRIGADIASGAFQKDVDFSAYNPTVADKSFLTLLSGVTSVDSTAAGFANRKISVISYRMATSPDNQDRRCLLRAGKALGWKDRNFMGLQPNGFPPSFSDPTYTFNPTDNEYDVLSPGVIQVVIGYQLTGDGKPALLADGTTIDHSAGNIVYSPPVQGSTAPANAYIDQERIGSLIVGLVIIDPEKLKVATAANVDDLATAFSTPPATGKLPVENWMAATSSLSNLPGSVPLQIRQSVKLYQRFFPLPKE